ncbi:hypothetical protein JCM15519_26630 [Fundidesulfovibrio butyratiphilus]
MANTKKKKSFWFSASTAEARDTGMAMTLICMLVALFGDKRPFLLAAIAVLLVNMVVPAVFKPVAKLWFGLSHLLGTVMSKVLLSLVFFLVLTPMGLLRKLFGKDSMQMRRFKKGDGSVFRVREHTFTATDIETPY